MSNGVKYAFIFSLGAVIGGFATWRYLKPKYEHMVQEEVNEFKRDWSGHHPKEEPTESDATSGKNSAEIRREELRKDAEEYNNIITMQKYTEVLEKGGSKMNDDEPYVISPLKFAEQDEDYEVISLVYHEPDGILVDELGEVVENADDIVGTEYIEHFGEYTEDPDTVYVRNEKLMTDYEIQRDLDPYAVSVDPNDDE